MSNDKVAAALGPGPIHVRVRETSETGTVELVYDDGRFLVRFEDGTAAVHDREDLISGWTETTGEHTKAKLVDDPYRNAVDPKDVPPAVAAEAQIPAYGMMQDYAETDVRLTNEMAERLYAELYPQPAPKPSRMLTPTEIIMSLLIIGAIVAGFVFTIFVIKIW